MRSRLLTVGAAAIVAGGVVGATPATAQDPGRADLEISLTGTTIAAGTPGKFGTVTLTNHGPEEATGLELVYDATGLDTGKVQLVVEGCPLEDGIAVCVIDPDLIAVGEHVTFFDLLELVPGATGDAGSITVSISHGGADEDESNNSFTAPVRIGDSGPDLLVFAPDITNEARIDFENLASSEVLDTPVVPGSDALVEIFVANQGGLAVSGVEVTIDLPEHVTFTAPEPECTHAVRDATTTCSYADAIVQPGTGSLDGCFEAGSCGWFVFPVEVAGDAPAPKALTGGVAQAFGMELLEEPPVLTLTVPALPENFVTGELPEVDPTDNSSEFTVFVSEAHDGGQGGGLPVTGVPALLIGGAGAAVLTSGVVLFLLGRRRRVILEMPESPAV
jgi:hypothetical protein